MSNLLAKLAAFLFVLSFLAGAQAQEVQQDTGLVCDTTEQMDSVLAAYDGGTNFTDALTVVNAEKIVCAVVTVAFYKGNEIKKVTTRASTLF